MKPMNTSKFSNRLRATPPLILRISGRRRRPVVVPTLPLIRAELVNAAAYRAFLLTSASKVLATEDYWKIAERNLNFVLENQNPDGSWFYAMDGVRDFVDHYHTCFVMKSMAKIYGLTGYEPCKDALSKGIKYYLENLFDEEGLPKPFSKAPRLTVYKRELYDCAECINLCLLLRDCFPALERTLEKVVTHVLETWVKPVDHSALVNYTWAGTMFPCIAGDNRRCFEASRFIFVSRYRDKRPRTED